MNERVYEFPGIFELGSSKDLAVRERWEARRPMAGVKVTGEIAEYGIVSEDMEQAHRFPIRRSLFGVEVAEQHFDLETLAAIDFRIRFCRWYLNEEGLPYDREDIFVDFRNARWAYASVAPDELKDKGRTDPLDFLLMWDFAFQGPGYAARILTHFARVEAIWDKSAQSTMDTISLAREWMLIGETWAEARFVVNHARAAVSGEKQVRAGKAGRDMRTDNSFKAVHGEAAQAMADDIAAKNPHLSWTAIRNRVAKEYSVSPETVKKSLTNPKKAG